MKNTNISVKKHQTYLVFFFALLISATMNAKVNHYLGGYAQVGEWSMLPSESNYGPSFGVAGGLGFLFEMQAGRNYSPTRFLLDVGVGAQGGMTSYLQSSSMTAVLKNQLDLQNWSFDYVYEVTDRHDQYTNVALQVPLMIGVQHKKFYMLAGVKVNASIWTLTHSSAMLNTYGLYAQFDEFRNMPEYQFFNDMPIKGSAPTSLNLDMDASLELGGRLGLVTDAVGYDVPKRKTELRFGAFFDYGLLDIHKKLDGAALGVPNPDDPKRPLDLTEEHFQYNVGVTKPVYGTTSMVDNIVMKDVMSTTGFAEMVRNLMVGVKFTILFQLPEQGKCVLCRDSYQSLYKSRSGGVKYEE